jgi:hypothetical protein
MNHSSRKAAVSSPELDPLTPKVAGAPWVDLVQQKVQAIEYGFVQIVVHDSHVVQVESTERHRFDLRRAARDGEALPPEGKLRAAATLPDQAAAGR